MAFVDDWFAEERDDREEQFRQERYDRFLEGKTDATFGRMPEYSDESYLEGWVAGIKELPTNPDSGRIQHYSSHKHFAFNRVDGAECYCACDEF